MEKTVSKLKQSIGWLEEAVKLVEANDLESLLKYYQVGYKGYGWHLQQFVLSQEFEVERQLAKHLEEVFEGTQFCLRKDIESPSDFDLFFQNQKVGFLDVYKRTLWFDLSAEDRVYQIKENIKSLEDKEVEVEKNPTLEEGILEEKKPAKGSFFGLSDKKTSSTAPEYVVPVETKKAQLKEDLEYYAGLYKQSYELLDKLLPHGFTLEYRM